MPPPSRSRQHRGVLEELLAVPAPPPAAPPPAALAPAPATVHTRTVPATPEARSAPATERFTTSLAATLVERLRTAVFHTPGLTLSGLAAEALEREIERLEAERGEPFPAGRGRLRTGRPVR
jgi:hypothetical protein